MLGSAAGDRPLSQTNLLEGFQRHLPQARVFHDRREDHYMRAPDTASLAARVWHAYRLSTVDFERHIWP